MAYLSIRGYNENLSKREAQEAVDFFGKHLMGRLYKHIDLDIEFRRLRGLWGHCGIISIERGKCRDFGIEVNSNLCKKNQIITLAHEMVHIKQFARNEFVCLDTDKYKWKNRIIRMSEEKYLEFPWEKEAYKLETELYQLYKESH